MVACRPCPDWGSNPLPLAAQDDVSTNWATGQGRFFSFFSFGGSGGERGRRGGGEGNGVLSSPHHIHFFLLRDAIGAGAELPLEGLATGMLSKQESVTGFFTFMSEFLRA